VILKLRIPALSASAPSPSCSGLPAARSALLGIFRAGVESVIAEAGKTPEPRASVPAFRAPIGTISSKSSRSSPPKSDVPGQNDRWTDRSAAIARRKGRFDWPVTGARDDRSHEARAEDALNYDLFKRQAEAELEGRRFPWELMPLSQLYGIQQSVPQILGEQMPARTAADYEAC